MKFLEIAAPFFAGALVLSVSDAGFAQSTIGGVKPQQNKIGGAAKPPSVVGGAQPHAPIVTPKPGPTVNIAKPSLQGATTSAGATARITPPAATNNARTNPPVTPPNKSGTVANLKCAAGACVVRGPKP